VAPLDSSSSSGLDTAGSSQGALAGTQALGSVTREAADSPAQEATSARDLAAAPAAEEADDIPMYTLGSDDEDDLAVVSNVEQARESQVGQCGNCLCLSKLVGCTPEKGSTANEQAVQHQTKLNSERYKMTTRSWCVPQLLSSSQPKPRVCILVCQKLVAASSHAQLSGTTAKQTNYCFSL